MLFKWSFVFCLLCGAASAYTTIEVDLQGSVEGGWPSALSGQAVNVESPLVNATNYQRWTFDFYFQPGNWPSPNKDHTNMQCDPQDLLEAAVFVDDLDKEVLGGSDGKKYAVWAKDDASTTHTVLPSELGSVITLTLNVTLKTRVEDQSGTDPSPDDGDTNSDGDVDFFDIHTIQSNFGMSNASWSDGDFDGDGGVDFADFLAAQSNYVPW